MQTVQVHAELLSHIGFGMPPRQAPLTRGPGLHDVSDGGEPTAVAFLPYFPAETTSFALAFGHLGCDETWRFTHGGPRPGPADVAEPFRQRSAWPTAFLGSGIENDHCRSCVQQMAKMVTSSTNQTVCLERAQLNLSACVQPRDNGSPHPPCVNIKACKNDQFGLATQGILRRN